MSVMVQIRNMPDATHRTLKARAATAGMSLSDYLLRELDSLARQPTQDEIIARIRSRPRLAAPVDTAAIIRELRDRE